jgi:hypothetical protein
LISTTIQKPNVKTFPNPQNNFMTRPCCFFISVRQKKLCAQYGDERDYARGTSQKAGIAERRRVAPEKKTPAPGRGLS